MTTIAFGEICSYSFYCSWVLTNLGADKIILITKDKPFAYFCKGSHHQKATVVDYGAETEGLYRTVGGTATNG